MTAFKFWRVNVEIEKEKKNKIASAKPKDRMTNAPYRDEGEAKIVWKPPWTPSFGYGYRVISHVPSKEYKDKPHVGVCVALASGIIYIFNQWPQSERNKVKLRNYLRKKGSNYACSIEKTNYEQCSFSDIIKPNLVWLYKIYHQFAWA